MTTRNKGQILPVFALMIVSLFAVLALAIDVSSAYASRRAYRTAADAAALAGAQDLQQSGNRLLGSAQYNAARDNAKLTLERQLGASATCSLSGTRSNCTFSGSTIVASIVTPLASAGSCATCDPARAVQVTVANPTFALSFGPVLGVDTWNVAVTSVAGLHHAKSYAIVMLRPPTNDGAIPGVRDIEVAGGSTVEVGNGDVGTNANMVYSGTNSKLRLETGYSLYYFDPYNAPLWSSPPNPPGVKVSALVLDPNYPIPSRSGGSAGGLDMTGCADEAAFLFANIQYRPSVPVTAANEPDMSKIQCYGPGIYSSDPGVSNGNLAILKPGLYFFDGGLQPQGSVIGGYRPGVSGVALVFRPSAGTQFKARTGGGSSSLKQVVALNAGSKFLDPGGQEATAARDYAGRPVQTNTTSPTLMTVIVPPDPACPVQFPMATTCTNNRENNNKAIDLSGGTRLYLAGVQYAPSDNMSIAGNSETGGYIGQVWGWTVVYTGGSTINQQGSASQLPGTIRLDAACTAPGINCTP